MRMKEFAEDGSGLRLSLPKIGTHLRHQPFLRDRMGIKPITTGFNGGHFPPNSTRLWDLPPANGQFDRENDDQPYDVGVTSFFGQNQIWAEATTVWVGGLGLWDVEIAEHHPTMWGIGAITRPTTVKLVDKQTNSQFEKMQ